MNQTEIYRLSIGQRTISSYHIIAVLIALSIFVAGRFGFFDILGLKRVLEIVIFIPICILGIFMIILTPSILVNPFFLLPFSFFCFQIYWNPNIFVSADLLASSIFISVIIRFGPLFSDLLLRYFIKIATLFALLGLIEFFLLLLYPHLVSHILLFYDFYSGSKLPVIQNVMQLLGLADGTSYHLWGMQVTRLRSFASEPSLLVGYFLIPGALALTYKNRNAFFGFLCIFFCACSLAGSVYAAFCLSTLSILFFFYRKQRLAIILPALLFTIFFWFLNFHFDDLILTTKMMGGDYDFLDKTNSATMRFSYIRDFIPKILASPFGLDEELHQPLGLILGSAAHSGVLGLLIILLMLYRLFSRLGALMIRKTITKTQKVGLMIIYGALLTGMLYLDNCFNQFNGFILLLLTQNRLQKLLLNDAKSE